MPSSNTTVRFGHFTFILQQKDANVNAKENIWIYEGVMKYGT
jgi:hypothetical protein